MFVNYGYNASKLLEYRIGSFLPLVDESEGFGRFYQALHEGDVIVFKQNEGDSLPGHKNRAGALIYRNLFDVTFFHDGSARHLLGLTEILKEGEMRFR